MTLQQKESTQVLDCYKVTFHGVHFFVMMQGSTAHLQNMTFKKIAMKDLKFRHFTAMSEEKHVFTGYHQRFGEKNSHLNQITYNHLKSQMVGP